MKNYIIIPDSFKGTITSTEVCNIMEKSIKKIDKNAIVKKIPIADGGEGTVDAFLAALGGEKIWVTVNGPYMENLNAFYGVLNDKKTAVIEMATCAGLPLVEDNANPLKTSTYGVGELIKHAIKSGCNKIIVGLGGSCTNDFGAGMAVALGVKFFNHLQESFIPTGGTLCDVKKIDISEAKNMLKNISIFAMCDVNNPMYGSNGAAYIFASQKGADTHMIQTLDKQLEYLSNVIKKELGIDVQNIAGSGAAGGMGGGMYAFLGAELKSGIETILDTVEFDTLLSTADIVFTGEGRIDAQSLQGKVLSGIARRTKDKKIPLIAIVGDILDPIDKIYEIGVSSVISINRTATELKIAKSYSKQNLELTMENVIQLLNIPHKL